VCGRRGAPLERPSADRADVMHGPRRSCLVAAAEILEGFFRHADHVRTTHAM
jgi:hypothetical protein